MTAYYAKLNEVLDRVFEEADNQKVNDQKLADLAGLHYSTVQRLSTRLTQYPYFRTVFLLVRAVGLDIDLSLVQPKKRKSA